MNLKDKIILITGSSRGIGAATARLAVEYGARVLLHGRTYSPHLDSLVKELKMPYTLGDISKSLMPIVNSAKRCDVTDIIHCVGENYFCVPENNSPEDWHRVFETNLFALAQINQELLPQLRKTKNSSITMVSSMRGIKGNPQNIIYSTAKAAVIAYAQTFAKCAAPTRVNCVCPGTIETEMLEDAQRLNPTIDYRNLSLLGRTASPMEVAKPLLFLVSDLASYITGTIITVDGGAVLK